MNHEPLHPDTCHHERKAACLICMENVQEQGSHRKFRARWRQREVSTNAFIHILIIQFLWRSFLPLVYSCDGLVSNLRSAVSHFRWTRKCRVSYGRGVPLFLSTVDYCCACFGTQHVDVRFEILSKRSPMIVGYMKRFPKQERSAWIPRASQKNFRREISTRSLRVLTRVRES